MSFSCVSPGFFSFRPVLAQPTVVKDKNTSKTANLSEKISREVKGLDVKSACIAGVFIRVPNFNAI